jgi:hypothetical protein
MPVTNDGMTLVLSSERGNRYRGGGDSRRFATARAIRIQSPVFRELLARLCVQRCFVDFSAQTKRNFASFDFLRIAQLHFDGNGADDRHPVVVIMSPCPLPPKAMQSQSFGIHREVSLRWSLPAPQRLLRPLKSYSPTVAERFAIWHYVAQLQVQHRVISSASTSPRNRWV